jgi:DNA-binding NarL/FixJ family response regulator
VLVEGAPLMIRNGLRILIADDHDVVRSGLRHMLEAEPGWIVCGEATNGRDAVELAKELVPDIVVLDHSMPDLNGLEATRQIKKAVPSAEILIFTMHESEQLIRNVLAAGARGFLMKSDAARYIVLAVEILSQHKPFFTSKVSETMLESFLRSGKEGVEPITSALTPREREILQLLAEGNSNKKVASQLDISIKTVETHRSTIMRKVGVNSITDLVRYAIRNHYTMP